MAFITKKEQSLIKAINCNSKLPANERSRLVQNINYNARLRQDGYRQPVREFIQAMANYNTNKVLQLIKS